MGPHHLPKFWGKKPKAATNLTLTESPIKLKTLEARTLPDGTFFLFKFFSEHGIHLYLECTPYLKVVV